MSIPTFKYYLKKNYSIFYCVQNGSVVETTTKTELSHSPEGWQDSAIVFNRDLTFWGVFYEISDTFQFKIDAAKIFRYIDAIYGYQGPCILYVELLNTTNFKFEFYNQTDIDLTQGLDTQFDVSLNGANIDIQELINSRQDTTYQLDLNAPEALTLSLDGVNLVSNALYIPGQGDADSGDLPQNILAGSIEFETLNIIYSGQQVAATSFISPKTQEYDQAISILSLNSGNWLFRANTNLTDVNFNGLINAIVRAASSTNWIYTIYAIVKRGTIMSFHNEILYQQTGLSPNTDIPIAANINHTLSIPLQINDLIYIVADFGITDEPNTKKSQYPTNTSTLYVTYNAKVSPTTTKCLRQYDAFNSLINQLSNGTSSVISNLLNVAAFDAPSRILNWDTSFYHNVLTCGNALRQLANPVIKTSLTEAFSNLFSQTPACLSIEDGKVRIEKIDYAFSDELIVEIFDINNMVKSDFKEKFFNDFAIGYTASTNSNVQNVGQNEFNTSLEFIPDQVITKQQSKVNNISPYNAAVSDIEATRAQTIDNTQASSTDDNTTFAIEIDPTIDPITGFYVVYRPVMTITGVDDPVNIYNVLISPGRGVRRSLPFYRSFVDFGNLIFQTTDKNPNLVSSYLAGNVIETDNLPLDSDIYNGHDISKIIDWRLFEFDCVPPVNLLALAKANPRGYIRFPYYGNTLEGYIYQLSITPASGATHCKLIGRAQNNPLLLIR